MGKKPKKVKMVTILISRDEKNIQRILTDALQREGYGTSVDLKTDDMMRLAGKINEPGASTLKDIITRLGESLCREKNGVLYRSILEIIEKPLIEYTLERTEGNQLKAARILGINRNTMRSKIKRLNIDVDRWKVPIQ
ncbi:MAG: helix-turn-helix domain-containing protein [Candidatus Omnitrophota bacterium]